MEKIAVSACLAFLVAGCKTTVDLTVSNPTTVALQTYVVVKDSSGIEKNRIELGIIATNQNASAQFEVKHGGQFVLSASMPGSVELYSQPKTITGDESDPFTNSIALTLPINVINPAASAQQIQDALSRLGANVGFDPIPLQNGLDTIFGSLLVITPPNVANADEKIHFKLAPGQFSPRLSLSDFRYPDDTVSSTVEIDGSSSSKVAASVPMYGSLGVDYSSDSIYKVNFSLNGFGMVEKPDPTNWTYNTAIQNLSPADKAAFYKALLDNPGALALYVNKIYVVKRAHFDLTKGFKLSADAKLDAGSVLTASGAYNFSKKEDANKDFNDTIVNIGGIQIHFDIVTVTTNANSMTALSTQPIDAAQYSSTPAMTMAIDDGTAILTPSKVTPVSEDFTMKTLKLNNDLK
jgi:hypothetical protein